MTARLAAAAFALFTLPAFAGEAASHPLDTVNVHAGPRLVVHCGSAHLPPLRAVAAVLDTNNGAYVYRARERLLQAAGRECARGYEEVVFVRALPDATPALAMLSPTKMPTASESSPR